MELRDYIAAVHGIPGIGWKTIKRLDEAGWKDVMGSSAAELRSLAGLSVAKASAIAALRTSNIKQMKESLRSKGIEYVTFWDDHYPALLKHVTAAPWVLYYKGDWSLVNEPALSIVGTRVPTAYGRRVAEWISKELSAYGFCIVSGLARGIDSIAHQSALQGKRGTIAVLGTPLDVIYPPENRALYSQIAEQGLLISEYPLGTGLTPGMFPLRNRIIAGLTLGTIVVEGTENSGSLITADRSLEANREVFAVPGQITSPKSQGPLKRIQMGAKLITGPEDVLDEFRNRADIIQRLCLDYSYSSQDKASSSSQKAKQSGQTQALSNGQRMVNLSEEERNILDLIAAEPVSFDQILAECKFTFGHLHSILLSLTMKNQIVQIPGSMYIRTKRTN